MLIKAFCLLVLCLHVKGLNLVTTFWSQSMKIPWIIRFYRHYLLNHFVSYQITYCTRWSFCFKTKIVLVLWPYEPLTISFWPSMCLNTPLWPSYYKFFILPLVPWLSSPGLPKRRPKPNAAKEGEGKGKGRNQAEITKGNVAPTRVGNRVSFLNGERYGESETSLRMLKEWAFRLSHLHLCRCRI